MPKKPPQTFEEKVFARLDSIDARLRAMEISQNELVVATCEVIQSVDAIKSVVEVETIVDISEPTDPPGNVDFTKWLNTDQSDPKLKD